MGILEAGIGFLGPWSWWILGIILAAIEVVAPGTFFIWFAVAAMIVGTLALVVGLSWQVELVLFVVLAIVLALVGRKFYGRAGNDADDFANERLNRQTGRIAVVDTGFAGGTGHINLDNTLWRAEGPDLPAGARVRIVGNRDGRFLVEPEKPGTTS